MEHDSVLFATNTARDNIQRDNLNPLIINMSQGRDIKCMKHLKSGGVGGLLIVLGWEEC